MDANVSAVERRTAALLDDPGMSNFDSAYLRPFINQVYDDFIGEISSLGLEFSEQTVELDISAGTPDLSQFMLTDDQPLSRMRAPKSIDWKPQGQPSTAYLPVEMVDELDDEDPAIQTIDEWAWVGGELLMTPCAINTTVRVRFESMSPTLYDPSQDIVRGVTNVLTYNAAAMVFDLRGNARLALKYEGKGMAALNKFKSLCVADLQMQVTRQRSAHRRVAVLNPLVGCILSTQQ